MGKRGAADAAGCGGDTAAAPAGPHSPPAFAVASLPDLWLHLLQYVACLDPLATSCLTLRRASVAAIAALRADLSLGQELTPIPVSASLRTIVQHMPRFDYCTHERPSLRAALQTPCDDDSSGDDIAGCDCANSCCSPAATCSCAATNLAAGDPSLSTFECHSRCACACTAATKCPLRATSAPLHARLRLDHMGAKGWGVRARAGIPAGAFVCCYAGERVSSAQLRLRLPRYDALRTSYVLTAVEHFGGHAGDGDGSTIHSRTNTAAENTTTSPTISPASSPSSGGGGGGAAARQPEAPARAVAHHIDATRQGNVARFFNHACEGAATLEVRAVHVGSMAPRLAFFARRAIAPADELTFCYGAAPASGSGGGGTAASGGGSAAEGGGGAGVTPCLCGAQGCAGWLPSASGVL